MYRVIFFMLLLVSAGVKAQDSLTYESVDSITYNCYLTGNWEKLFETAEQSIAHHIDFKRLRQRMGYAYFVKADYYASQKQYEKALEFDEYDADTREYLYYCGLNTGNIAYARYHAAKLPEEAKKRLHIRAINPVASVDLEYNYKVNNGDNRSNPSYFRGGIYSQAGYRLSLYQSASNYKQTVNSVLVKQPDYFALLNWSVTSHITFSAAYHYLNTSLDGYKYPGNLLFSSLSTRLNRISLGVNVSFFRFDIGDFKQVGIHAGIILPGKSNVYFTSHVNGLIEKDASRLIFAQYAGARILKTVWLEGILALGNLQNYNDHNALYVYNSIDPTLFRTGLSLYWNINRNLTFYSNYLYDTKQVEQTTDQYIQQSFLGGFIWKL